MLPHQLSHDEMDVHCPSAEMPEEDFENLQDYSFEDLPKFDSCKTWTGRAPDAAYHEDLREPGDALLRPAARRKG